MALINCRECEKEISSEATVCPHCGCPVNEQKDTYVNNTSNENVKNKKKPKRNIGCDLGCLFVLIIFIVFVFCFCSNINSQVDKAREAAVTAKQENNNDDLNEASNTAIQNEIEIEKFSLVTTDSLINSMPTPPSTSFHNWQMIDSKEVIQIMLLEYRDYNFEALSFEGCIGRVTYYPKAKIAPSNINDLKICLGITSEQNFNVDSNRQDLYVLNQPTDKIYSVNAILDINRQYVEEVKVVYNKKFL